MEETAHRRSHDGAPARHGRLCCGGAVRPAMAGSIRQRRMVLWDVALFPFFNLVEICFRVLIFGSEFVYESLCKYDDSVLRDG